LFHFETIDLEPVFPAHRQFFANVLKYLVIRCLTAEAFAPTSVYLAIRMLTVVCTAVTQVALGHIYKWFSEPNQVSRSMITASTSTDSRSVFLVDDDSSTADLYSRGLEQAGFKTSSVSDTKDAFKALPNLSADLIILDLMLPKGGGFELLEAIRSDSRQKKTPILLLCNAYLPDLTLKALKA